MNNVGLVQVIYRVSSDCYEQAYSEIQESFAQVKFIKQSNQPTHDFKPLTMRALADCPHRYVMFAVDDIVVKDGINCAQCISYMQQTDAYGFYLRLGLNLNYCYSENRVQPLPILQRIDDDVASWIFSAGMADWAYPHSVDMVIYRKADVTELLKLFPFATPNQLEGQWACRAGTIMQRRGLCFNETKIVNLPLNRVQHDYANRSMTIDPQELLNHFVQGKKMDIAALYQIKNTSAHMEYTPTFIARV
jgi:hypothetical protein